MMVDNTKICICGIGPGHPDYITKIVYDKVESADILIGGKRQLAIFADYGKPICVFNGQLNQLKSSIEQFDGRNMVVLVSGDTGFHSLRRFIVDAFPMLNIELVPGISSFQYLYAKLGLGYEKALVESMHGTQVNYMDKISSHSSVFLLTDKKNNWRTIAQNLVERGFGCLKIHIGDCLSYPNETIISTTAAEALIMEYDFELCSVVIENADYSNNAKK